jgi:transcriptional regulator with XRE-family HTH domain
MTTFGNNVRQLRKSKGWTRVQLCGRSSVHINTIADIENGRNKQPSFEKVILICRALKVEPLTVYPVE